MKVRIEKMNVADLKLLEVNARYMKHETFQQLVNNIKRDGQLTSIPLVWKDEDGKYLVLSGNHRTMAAKEAGLDQIYVMATDDPLTKDQRIAIQLSHNSLEGEDDPVLLKKLYEEIGDLDLKLYTGLDDKTLDLLKEVNIDSLSSANLEFQPVTLVFLPNEKEAVEQVFKQALEVTPGKEFWTARWNDYDTFMDSMTVAMDSYDVKNVATALSIILRVFTQNVRDLQDGWCHQEKKGAQVPIMTLLGKDTMRQDHARIVNRALEKMIDRSEIKKEDLTAALAIWAQKYLEETKNG